MEATRRLLTRRGYSQVTIADIAAEAKVTRPTIYRRWPGKLQLVSDALEYGLATQQAAYLNEETPPEPFQRFRQAVMHADPLFANSDAIILQGNFIGETNRTPELMDLLTARAVEPRVAILEKLLEEFKGDGVIRPDVDCRTVTTMCFGSFFGAHLRGERDHRALADRVATEIWAGIVTR
jgi:AcrR family transcriptional regulator